MSQRKHYHIHAPYQHPQQQQQHHHPHTQQPQPQQQQQHHAQHQQQQQWYTHGTITQPQQQHYHPPHSLHMRDSRHIQHHQQQQHQQPHHNHHTMPHMFTSGYVGMATASGGGGDGGGRSSGGSSTHNTHSAAVAQHNMPASSSSSASLHYSTTMPSASSVGGSVRPTSNTSGVGIVGRNRIFDLEMLNTQHSGASSAAHSHSMLSGPSSSSNSNNASIVSGRSGTFDAFSHNSLYAQQNPRHLPHHHPPPPAHSLHHSHQTQHHTPHHHQQQQHYYHHQQPPLHRQQQQQHLHQQVIPPMLQNIKSEPVEHITITPSIQTDEIIIKSEPMDEVTFHKNAPQHDINAFNMEEKRKQHQQLQEQQHHHHQQTHHHHQQHRHENVSHQTQRLNLENSTTTATITPTPVEKQQTQISLTNVKTEPKPLNFPRRKLQTERSSTLPICQRCKQVFLKRQSYTQHVALSSCNIVEYDFKCSICPMSFMSNEELQTHEQLHRMNRYFCQKYCGKFYETIEECEQHEYGQHEYEIYKCNICCISLSERDQLFAHLAEHGNQSRFDCCICRLCFQTSMELHEHYMTNEEFCGKYYDKQAFKTQQITSSPYLGKPESSHFEIANTFSLKDIPPSKSHEFEPLYNKHQQKSKSSHESRVPPSSSPPPPLSYNSNIPEFPFEPQVEVKTEIKVEPDFYPPMDQTDFPNYDNDYGTPDYPQQSSNENLAFLQDFQDNASNSTNSSYSLNTNEPIQDENAICCVPKCGVRKMSSPSLQFYTFPRDEKYLSQWLHNLKMSYDPNLNYGIYRICSLHFPKRCVARYSLSYWAVPTFNLGHDDVGNLYQNRESSGGFPAGDMAKCSMPGCPSQRGETNVKFHVFPRDLKTLIKWCQNSRLPVHSKENRFFCSKHFEEKCFGKFRLKPWAIPTLNLGTVYGKIHDNPNIYQEEKKCFLPYCRRSRSYDCNLSLYRFPRDETLLKRWCYNLRLDPEIYRGKNHKICSSHFIKEALGLRKLNPGAVPTLNLGHNDRFNIYENELYTPPPPPSPQPSTSSASVKAQKFAEMFKHELGGSSHIYDEVFMNSMIQKFSSSSNSNASSSQLDLGDVCLVPSCKRTRHSDEITLHTVPKRAEQLKKWCHNLKMDLEKMHKSVRICSAHFEKYCIGGCMRPFAVPTIELGHDDSNIYRNPDVIKKLNIRETCCIGSCKRNRDRDHANLHRFPTHPELLQKWCENLQKAIPDGTKLFNDAVCEIHFEDRCLRNKRLEKWAIPTLNLGWDEAPHILPSEEEITEYWTKPFAPNNGDEQGECCVSTCKRNPQIDDVKLYRPPEDPEQMVKWAHNLQVDVMDLPNLKICSLHFEQHCIGKRLLNWAMPTLNLATKVEHLFENPPPMPNIYKKKEKPERIHSTADAIKWSPRCSLPHCRKARTLDRVHLFRFPYNNRQVLHKWCHNLQLPLVGSSHRRICSSHFESSVLTKRCPMTLAVPTIDLNAPPGYKIYPNPTRLKQLKVGPQRQCLIESCRKTKLDGVILFRFPNNRTILQKWRHNIKTWPKGKLSNQFRICSEHFEPHSVGQKKLSPGAIPTLKLGHEAKDLYPNETRSFFDLAKCAITNCDSRKEMEDVRLFRFPRDDDDLLKKWCHNLKMEANDCVGIRICSKHFEVECLGPRMLYKWAVPTLKLGHKEDDTIEIMPNPPPEQRTGEFLYKCCIPGCGKTRKYDDAQMNSFPKHLKLFKKWKHNLKLDFLNFKEREKYKICNDHFEPVCVGKTRLNFGALPTLKLGHDDVEDLYKINPERIRPNLFVKQKDIERIVRQRILRKDNQDYDEALDDQDDDIADPLGLDVSDIKCCVSECTAPKSIMREPYDLPESKELRNLWQKVSQEENVALATEAKLCGLHFQKFFQQLKPQMQDLLEKNPDLKTDFNKLNMLYQKSSISLVICSYQCRVSDCSTNLLNSDIRLFFFPYGKNLINKWSYNTGIVPDEHRRYMNKVCALHFESYCISENQRLRNWAIPTLNLPPLKEEEEIYQNPDLTKIDKRMLGPQILKCAVKHCLTDKLTEDESVKLFNFPSEEKILKKWCVNLKMTHEFTPLLKICSLHFEKLCFGSCRIRSWAIPTLNLGHSEEPKHFNKSTITKEVYEASDVTTEPQLKQVKIKKSLDTTKCFIASCRKSRLQHGVRFYSLPIKTKIKRKWLHNLQVTKLRSGLKLHNIKICNLHFHKKCLEGKHLKSWAVPTMHLGHSENIFENPRRMQGLPIIRCALSHCKNKLSNKEIRCFVFPKSREFLEKWSKNLKLSLEKCKGRICIEHFEKAVIGEKKLKNGAVPTLNLAHNDPIYDNEELIQKLKLKNLEKQKQNNDTIKNDDDKEDEQQAEDMAIGEEYEGEEEEEDEEEYEEDYEMDDDNEEEDYEYEYGDDKKDDEEQQEDDDDDKASISTTLSQWSSVINKELRVTLTAMTPDDLYDLCSRSSYEREFGSMTPSSRRSVTPSTSLKDFKTETFEQKSHFKDIKNENYFKEPQTDVTEQKTDPLFREPRSQTPDQSLFRVPRAQTPDQKLKKLKDTFDTERFEINFKQEEGILATTQMEEEENNTSTALRTDKALNSVAPICCLKYCGKEKTPQQHLTTYGFPKDPQLLQRWCDNLGLQPDECIGRVCIDHFELRVIGIRRLKPGAVPTLNLGQNRIAKHNNTEETTQQQKKSVSKDASESGNLQDTDLKLLPPPPYATPKPAKHSVFRLCCLKHCRRKKELAILKGGEKEQDKLFPFPKDSKMLRKWCKNLRLPEKSCLRHDLEICEKHFENMAILGDKLHSKAVPTLDLSYAQREPVYLNNPQDFLTDFGKIKTEDPDNEDLKHKWNDELNTKLTQNSKSNSKSLRKIKTEFQEKCFLEHCGKSGDSDELFLIPFPQHDSALQRRWSRNLKLSNKFSQHKHLKICSDHFEPYLFYRRRLLKTGAVPTLQLGHSDIICKNFRRLRLKKVASSKKEQCCIDACQESNLKLYAFPRSSELRKLWCNNLQIEVRKALNNHYKICGKHFSVESFIVGTDNLKLNAVPILNLGLGSENHIQIKNEPSDGETLKCLVENCQKTPSVDRVKLYKFPLRKDILKKWLSNLNISLDSLNDNSLICDRHFHKFCIKNGSLHEKAIPTQFLEVSPKGWFYQNNEELFEEPKPECIFQCQELGQYLYKFPKQKEELEKWIFNIKIKIEESELHKLRICALHFEDACKLAHKDMLLPGSLPTLNLGHDYSEGIYQNNFVKCCLATCSLEGFQFHKLPEDLMLQSFWFQELEMETTYNNSLYICSVHYLSLYERVLEKFSAYLKESKEYVKLSLKYQELKALTDLQSFKCHIPHCSSGFKLIWKLFKFPKDEGLFNKWLHNTGLSFEHSKRNVYRICAQHFEERCLSEIKLHRWSLPTLKLPFNNSLYVNPPEALPSNHENLKHCCVSNCLTEKEPFFKFPKQPAEIKKWIHNLQLGSQQCTLNLRVCYRHFESYCFSKEENNKIKQLKYWSVPTLRLKRKKDLHLNPADKMAYSVCFLPSCRQIRTNHLILFTFPRSNTLKQKWFHNLNLNPQDFREKMRLCAKHFEMDCFDKSSKALRKHSVPTLELTKPQRDLYKNPLRRPHAKCYVRQCKGPWPELIAFPKEKSLLRKWCHNLQIDIKLELLRNWKICGKHFEMKCRNQNGSMQSLAVPTLKLGHNNKKIFKNPKQLNRQPSAIQMDNIKQESHQEIKKENPINRKKALKEDTQTLQQLSQKLKATKNLQKAKHLRLKSKKKSSHALKALKEIQSLNESQFTQTNNFTQTKLEKLPEQSFTIIEKPKAFHDKFTQNSEELPEQNFFSITKPKALLENITQHTEIIEEREREKSSFGLNEIAFKNENLFNEEDYLQDYMNFIENEESNEPNELTENYKALQNPTKNNFNEVETQEEYDPTTMLKQELQENYEDEMCQQERQEESMLSWEDSRNYNEDFEDSRQMLQVKPEGLEDYEDEYTQEDYLLKKQENSDNESNFLLDVFQDRYTMENENSGQDNYEFFKDYHKNKKIACYINTCANHLKSEKDLKLYKFPTHLKLKNIWVDNCQLSIECSAKRTTVRSKLRRTRICPEHFERKCFRDTRLLYGSIPTLKMGLERVNQQSCEDSLITYKDVRCIVPHCQRSQQYDDIYRIKFPPAGELKSKWCFNLNLNEEDISKTSWLCNRHFESRVLLGKTPRHYAVPTLCLDENIDPQQLYQNPKYITSAEYAKQFKDVCCVKSCPNTRQNSKLRFATFVICRTQDMYEKWLYNLDLEHSSDIRLYYHVCFAHFESACITSFNQLKYGAIPTLNLDKKDNLYQIDLESMEYANSSKQGKYKRGRAIQNFSYQRWLCQHPQCLSLRGTTFKWPSFGIFKKIWLETLEKYDTQYDPKAPLEELQDLEICDEHFYVLYKANKLKILTYFTNDLNEDLREDLENNFQDLSEKRKFIQRRCMVPQCDTDHLFDEYKDITLYTFSQQPDISKKWCFNCNIDVNIFYQNNYAYKICKLHFEPYCFTFRSIYNWAVPTLKLPDTKPENILQNDPENKFAYTGECCIKSCRNSQGLGFKTKTKFFRFPSHNPRMLQKWLEILNLDINNIDLNELRICGLHFHYSHTLKKAALKDTAYPTQHLDFRVNRAEKQNEMDENIQVKQELDTYEEWCDQENEERHLVKRQSSENYDDQSKLEKIRKESNEFESIEIKEECLEMQQQDYEYYDQTSEINEAAQQELYSNIKPSTKSYKECLETQQQDYEYSSQTSVINVAPQQFELNSNIKPSTQSNTFSYIENPSLYTYIPNTNVKEEVSEQQPANPNFVYFPQKPELYQNSPPAPSTSSNFIITDVKSQIILCCVQKCLNSSETADIQMFTDFPNDSEIFIKWCFNLKIDPRNYKDKQYAVCQQHFESHCFTENLSLHTWSVPTLYLNLPDNSFIHTNDPPQHLKPTTDQCIVYGCINPIQPLFRFPLNQDVSHKWFSNLKLDYTDFRAQNYRICRRHFGGQCFEGGHNLKMQAIPTLYLGHTDKVSFLSPWDDYNEHESLAQPGQADNSRGSSQDSLVRRLISPHDLEDHDSSYFEDFEEYYGQDD